MKVRYRELALADLEQIFLYLDERNPVAARNVIDAIHAAISNVADQPLSGRKTSDPSIRVKIVGRYHYKVFYSVGVDAIEVLHVRHGTRRPWFAKD
ncbi:MAG TPA: type II toxin-antitoxin system RelE/ParE family toxin [Xanthobacteraceae bacterium]